MGPKLHAVMCLVCEVHSLVGRLDGEGPNLKIGPHFLMGTEQA